MTNYLRIARRSVHLTQRAFAQRIAEHQPGIAAIEAGKRDVGVSHLEAMLKSTGLRLFPFKTSATPACIVADAIYDDLRTGHEPRAFRRIIQLSDDLSRSSVVDLVCLIATPPPSTGDERYDALLAGLCEHYVQIRRAPKPSWLETYVPLDDPWYVDDDPHFHAQARRTSPKSLAKRNVYLAASELESV
jgi:transcriptional regulator with XRE-family HTH domain